ncbi:hypothetical protein Ocin01_17297 [Orchesella cincta]|uniref:Uncharacterized protein n=1 Tax=Orchesella cincta TaxID=48709 RepID=A0A1D2M8T7_ORCCI|nr:hypothetical protein Ocin01_17297 [Orchesella cincta]
MNLSSVIGVFQLLTAFVGVPLHLYYIYNFSWWGDIGFPAFVLAILVGAVLVFGFSLIGNLFFTSEDGVK